MLGLFISLIVVVAVLLIIVVLIQNSKSSGGPASGGATQLLGVSKSGDILEKITLGLAGTMLILCLGVNFTIEKPDQNGGSSANMEKASEIGTSGPAIQQALPKADSTSK